MEDWVGAGEEVYRKNQQRPLKKDKKTPKKHQKSEIEEKKHDIPWWQKMWATGREQEKSSTQKNQQRTSKKRQKNTKKTKIKEKKA